MEGIKIVAFAFILCGFQLCTVHSFCKIERNVTGRIIVKERVRYKNECWKIPVPLGNFIHLQFEHMESKKNCQEDYVTINSGTSDVFCSREDYKNPITTSENVFVTHFVFRSQFSFDTAFTLKYTIKTLECLNKNSFKCDNNSCVPKETVCDGVKDCKNGADEIGCDTGVFSIRGFREKAVSWLKQKRTAAWGWRENTPRAVVALYLASAASFNGTVLEEELMAKQTELKTAVALL
ncbi:hypothetical protein AVEN_55671-1, partial [Araneus ventricosus]